ncbi:hypothetical protein LZL87_014173 [Fusarium oxysporum]|nr:hypothetical protein LZL87_014173 [Fusarium oxysporum]
MKPSGGANVEADWDAESIDREEDYEDEDEEEDNSDDESSVMGADNSEADNMDDRDDESEQEDDDRNENQSWRTNKMGNSGWEKILPWIKEVLELLFGLIMAFCTEERHPWILG